MKPHCRNLWCLAFPGHQTPITMFLIAVVPIPKPGKCPPPPNILCVRAENKCSSDRNCPGRQKCCPGGCGTLCRYPGILDLAL